MKRLNDSPFVAPTIAPISLRVTLRRALFALIVSLLALALSAGRARANEVEFGSPDRVAGWALLPFDVALGDLDGDGDVDVATGSSGLTWFENIGGLPARFPPRESGTHGVPTPSLSLADLDGDGRLDMVGTNPGNFEVLWYGNLGGAPPTFSQARRIAIVPGFPSEHEHVRVVICTADMDGDGDVDVVSRSNQALQWHENDGGSTPSFATHAIDSDTNSGFFLFLADLDGDGDDDLVTVKRELGGGDEPAWYENDGDDFPNFILRHLERDLGIDMPTAAHDLDGDGDMDLLATAEGSLAWYENDGATPPVFTARLMDVEFAPPSLQRIFGDLDGDGDEDIVTFLGAPNPGGLSSSLLAVGWMENLGGAGANFAAREVLGTAIPGSRSGFSTRSIAVADMEGDGDLDIVLVSIKDFDSVVTWFENDGGARPKLTRHLLSASVSSPYSVEVADMDGDGDTDILSGSTGDDRVMWYENQGGPIPWFVPHFISQSQENPRVVYPVDFDLDGDVDVLTGSVTNGGGGIVWFENDGSNPPGFAERVITESSEAFFDIKAADLDQDGDLDVIFGGLDATGFAWYENIGGSPPSFVDHPISISESAQGWSLDTGDIDGDGDLDILVPAGGAAVLWLENDGRSPPSFVEQVAADEGFLRFGLLADMDRDGDLDIVIRSNGGQASWLENDGASDPSFVKRAVGDPIDTLTGNGKLIATDVDRDGNLDVVVVARDGTNGTVAWHENDGAQPPSFITHIIVTERLVEQNWVAAGDLDGDGDMDLITIAKNSLTIRWFPNLLFSPFNASKPQWKLYP